ncbi:MlaD family protein [Polynucleobacter sp. AP-Latsch-80-C2]|jgi:phospholipid/cholesterol/gamma-HCH transport system substrate-binding protein/paraquat-inducible protein B|uniref:MlaD family protein n=1 Tax=Polynucleobacter sp. AP-Latsch-80-C2 TaxID=2576931 RepID=UPI001C0B971D|nr:MlaD family protein [Polynucleobacter sp. AP-Latsch-80-C2]MBU3624253.1 MCE family protein [Polynucleobacter sp. AP-Latsch-80-C2]
MSNNSNPNYFRLGVFVLAAIGVLIAVVLIFGSGKFFKKSFYLETYIKQSVTGLDSGAAVRFRGVKIGQVTTIGLSGDTYEKNLPFDQRRQYVVVRMKIFGEELTEEQLAHFVREHLRARVKSMGITGVNYIEFDFVSSAADYPPLPYDWVPEYPVLPSMPNQTDEIISGIEKFIASANEMNIERTQKRLDEVLGSLNTMMAGDGKGNEGIIRSVKELNTLLTRMAQVTDKNELNILMRELMGAVVSLRQTVTSAQGDTTATLENIKQASENLNELSRIASQSPASLIWGEPPPKIVLPMNGTQSPSGVQK